VPSYYTSLEKGTALLSWGGEVGRSPFTGRVGGPLSFHGEGEVGHSPFMGRGR